ncbi:MAG: N-acetylmuramoyl-L-alanine amidase [Clostridia bacterium]|nr:N-acetylmuramoyl-L-alanine amidase [Clostridia bacterium]
MIKRAFSICLALVLACSFINISAKEYPDVEAETSVYGAVDYLSDIGVIAGYEDGLFKPDRFITRGEAATLLARTLGYDESYEVKEMPFTDVAEGYWAEKFISYCYEGGLVNGMSEDSFEPANKVTHAQMIKMLVCAAGLEEEAKEYGGEKWYDGYIGVATEQGILEELEFFPDDSAPRGAVAVLVYNCIKEGLICGEEEDEEDFSEEENEEETEDEAVEEEPEKKEPVIAYKEDVVETVRVPKDYEFAVGIDYTPEFDIDDVDFSEVEELWNGESRLIVIDPGHNFSGYDIGAHNEEYELWEQNITWPIAKMLELKLTAMGFEVVMTRDDYSNNIKGESAMESLLNRAGIANGLEADLFISIHCNAGGGKGIETYCYKTGTKSEKLAEFVQDELSEGTQFIDRGVKTARFVVLMETLMPAILVEAGFIDTEEDFEYMIDTEGQNAISTAIAKGVLNYAEEMWGE